jgi:glycosyltransferase involved in cell wall biosynthesis
VKIGVDIRHITDFGVGTYLRNILRELVHLDHENQYYLIGEGERAREVGDLPENFHVVALDEHGTALGKALQFRRVVQREHCDLVHVPYLESTPLGLPCAYVVTAHDLLDYMYRARNGSSLRRLLHFQFTKRLLNHAARIFAVSHFTKNDIQRVFGIPAAKIEVVYNAIDDRFRHGHASAEDREFIAERYQVNYPFVLYAGRISPHKNIVRLIEAFSALKGALEKESKFPDLKLIIIGDDLSSHPDLRRTVIRSGMQNDVRFLGFVPVDVLRIFYDTAKLFVFPSLYEGFGLPPLEAMAHGTPVVTSNTSSLPEVVGNAAVLVNPENVFDIMRALHRTLVDQGLRDQLKQRGYEQASHYSWETSARRILEAYGEIVHGTKPTPSAPPPQPSIPKV